MRKRRAPLGGGPSSASEQRRVPFPAQGDEDSGPGLEGEYSFRQCDPLREVPPLELDGAYVTKLVLAENILDDEACAAMSLGIRELPHLRHLDVSGNSGLTWRACAALAELLATSNKVCIVAAGGRPAAQGGK